jgi:ribosomal protein S17E
MNQMLAFYLKNAPKLFNDNKRKIDKMLMMQGKGIKATVPPPGVSAVSRPAT